MSAQPVFAATANGPAGAVAATERMRQLQALIARVEEGPAGFVAALQAAQASPPAPGAGASPVAFGAAQASGSPAGLGASAASYPAVGESASSVAPGQSASYPAAGQNVTNPAAGQSVSYPAVSQSAGYPAVAGSVAPASVDPTAGSSAGGPYDALIAQAAARNGVDPAVLHGLIQQESGFDPNATSSAGALGLTQLMPGTASSLGVSEPLNPEQSIEGGARYLGQMLRQFGGNTADALAAYNAGPGAVQRYGGVPPYAETQQYVTKVLGYATTYRQSAPVAGAATVSGSTSAYGARQAAVT